MSEYDAVIQKLDLITAKLDGLGTTGDSEVSIIKKAFELALKDSIKKSRMLNDFASQYGTDVRFSEDINEVRENLIYLAQHS